MASEQTPFVLTDEVEKIHPVTDRARKRAEAAGLFPSSMPTRATVCRSPMTP